MSRPTALVASTRGRKNAEKPVHQERCWTERMIPSCSNCARREFHTRRGGSTSAGSKCAVATSAVKSAMRFLQELQPARCARAASGTGTKPSCERTSSTSLHCMDVYSATRCFGSIFGSTRIQPCDVRLLRAPRNFHYSNSIPITRLCLRSVAFLTRLLSNFLLEQIAQPGSRPVQLRFRISDRATHDAGDFF